MAAGKPHGVMAPTPLASSSSESGVVVTCLLVLGFLVGFFLVGLLTQRTFFGGVFVVGVDKSESSDFCSIAIFETLEF